MISEEKKTTTTMERHEPLTWDEVKNLLRRETTEVPEKTWRPTTGGLLSIVAGGLNVLLGILAIAGTTILTAAFQLPMIGVAIGTTLIVLGVIGHWWCLCHPPTMVGTGSSRFNSGTLPVSGFLPGYTIVDIRYLGEVRVRI